ncbi:MAG: hypothetical protein U0169_19645 [Polyangiaceae bacterium]
MARFQNPLTPFVRKLAQNPRENRNLLLLLGLLGAVLFVLLPVGLQTLVFLRKSESDDLRRVLAEVQDARGQVRDRKERKDQVVARYAKRAPPLAGFIEQTATAEKLAVSDSVDRPDVQHGKRYTERNTVIHLKKSGMLHVAKFMEAIEKSGYPVSVARLNLRRRMGEADSYDLEVGVSAFDRNEKTDPSADAKEKKP